MKKRLLLSFLIAMGAIFLFSAAAFPDEGEWLLTQIQKLNLDRMHKFGLQMTADQIYAPNATSLTSAICLLPGGTGSFVSNDGLIITNHHIAFGGIQSLSSVEDDYLKNGFLAKTRQEELSCPSYTAEVVTNIVDVTKDVLSAVSDTMSAENRSKAIQKKMTDLQNEAKAKVKDTTYRIFEMYSGVQYLMFTYDVVRDVRLVYAPPGAIGVFGGETDNWMWPRHTGDFAFLRAYIAPDGKHAKYAKENVPFHPKKFLPISSQALPESSFAMIMGFPGRTYRYRTAAEIKLAKEETYPMVVDWFQKRMHIMENAWQKDRALQIKYASKYKGIANTEKNYLGTLEGMQRSNVVALREEDEAAFHKYIDTKEELESKYESVLSDIAAAQRELHGFNKQTFYLGQFFGSIDLMRLGSRFLEYANSFQKDSTGTEKPSGGDDLKQSITSTFKDMTVSIDKEELVALILTSADLPKEQEIAAVKEIVGDKTGEEREKKVREFVDNLYNESHLTTPESANEMLNKSGDDIKDDAIVKFAAKISAENAVINPRVAKYNAEITRLRSEWIRGRMAWKGEGMYPDANRSIRFTYGIVEPYKPRDAVSYDFMTSISGIIEKESDVNEDFFVPKKLHDLWASKDFGPYTDPHVKEVPVAFLANLDITGGNSGSPVINGKGELIGVAFDGNWEAVVGDFYFQESLNRTISVDSRYVLFVLDKFAGAKDILNELVIK